MATHTSTTDTFDSLNPATGETVATFPIQTPRAVAETVAQAQAASSWWAAIDFDGRKHLLRRWKNVLARRSQELAELVHAENGKPLDDALIEIVASIDHIEWAARNAKRVLGFRKLRSGLLGVNQAAYREYQPFGVVGVIGPWNYPVFTPMGSLVYALAAGNTVVFKPSEYTTAVGGWLVDTFAGAIGRPDVLQLVTGDGSTGAALCSADIDKLAFTGSSATGRKVMAACAENLTPVLMECGGKDAMIVAADANLDAAADAAVWGAMSNAGQTCIGIERVYVENAVHDAFVECVGRRAAKLSGQPGTAASIGPITTPSQIEIIGRHVASALSSGAKAVVGGAHSVRAPYVDPVVLTDVDDSSPAMREETFGPTIGIRRVADLEEAVRRANDSEYGLGSAVFTRSKDVGITIARRLRGGMTAVNGVMSFVTVPGLPFGGVGESGFGRTHGDDGLREFARPKAIARERFRLPVPLLSFERPAGTMEKLARVMRLVHGRN